VVTEPTDVLAVIDNLPTTLHTVRMLRGASLRQVARDCGVSFSTITRIEHGEDCNLSHARAVLAWISDRP
jgi:transcriptional regulator with XRE-family HTH domain